MNRVLVMLAAATLLSIPAFPKDHSAVFPRGCQELREAWLEQSGPVTLRPATWDSLSAAYDSGFGRFSGATGALVFRPEDRGFSCRVTASGGPALRVLRWNGKAAGVRIS